MFLEHPARRLVFRFWIIVARGNPSGDGALEVMAVANLAAEASCRHDHLCRLPRAIC
jgi:hypothetical protein